MAAKRKKKEAPPVDWHEEAGGLDPVFRSMGWFVYQDYNGLWYARNPITGGRSMEGFDSAEEVNRSMQASFERSGLWIGAPNTVTPADNWDQQITPADRAYARRKANASA